ncbi:MAG: hypothetical protein HN952_07815 [Candidatus Cloacimonetes bacterium]|jgi:hypothetical protein|nr:hypothetical protein [Candidatus Cloacimonadota bacterium]MBT6994838.1 hypothetical protein [Candidatus Cloacimonadota bacterium]MBT7469214.1 hypothetical protein [Candidatus Cloacimonadota bacterium]
MKKLTIILGLILTISNIFADIQNKIEQFESENAKLFVQPLVNAFGTTMNTGFYHTAKVLKPFTFGLNVNVMMAFVPNEDKTFIAKRPDISFLGQNLYEEETIETATIFGEDGGRFTSNYPGITDLQMPDGLNIPAVPFAMPQFNLGLPGGNELLIRGFPKTEIDKDFGEFGFWGVGLKHSIDQYISLFPIDIAIQGIYQNLYVGDILKSTNINANLQVSKKLLMLTGYCGVGIDKTNVSFEYNYTYDDIDEIGTIFQNNKTVEFEIEGENEVRMTAGIRYSILLLKFYTDYTVSEYNTLNAGFGISF